MVGKDGWWDLLLLMDQEAEMGMLAHLAFFFSSFIQSNKLLLYISYPVSLLLFYCCEETCDQGILLKNTFNWVLCVLKVSEN